MSGVFDNIYQYSPIIIQQLLTTVYGISWYKKRYGKEFHSFVKKLRDQENYDIDQFIDYQEKQLDLLFLHASNSSYYSKFFEKFGTTKNLTPFERLNLFPILTKKNLHVHGKDLLTSKKIPRDVMKFKSSGTTGTPTEIYHPNYMLQKGQAWIEARIRNWVGLNYKVKRVMLGSRKICHFDQQKPPFWRFNPIENMAYMSIYHLSPKFLGSYIEFFNKFRPELIMGYPSALQTIAKYCISTNKYPHEAKAIITTSEELTPSVKELLEKVWGCKAYGTYGSVEHCVFASQCEHGIYHLSPEVGILEVVDSNGNPNPPGVSGSAICTGLHNFLQPLIRYEIGDQITLSKKNECKCGRKLPIIDSIDGRLESMCYLPDGRSTLRFDTVFKGVHNIWEAQVIQEKLDLFIIRVVPTEKFSIVDERLLIQNMKIHIGNINIEIEKVDMIERTSNGKFKAVICNLSDEEIKRVIN